MTSVLVTRPAGQADGLCQRITALGHEAIHVPAIAIVEPQDSEALAVFTRRLEEYDLVILVSINAVTMGLTKILQQRDWPACTQLATVGPSSSAAVEALGLRVDHIPEHEYSSEGLLALPALQDMQGRRVAILRGNGGRDTLFETLVARGAQVEYVEVYRRMCPQQSRETLRRLLRDKVLDVITVTSNETLQNLFEIAGQQGQPLLLDIPLVVASRRQAALAARLGFRKGAVIAGHASDEAMAAGVAQLFSS